MPKTLTKKVKKTKKSVTKKTLLSFILDESGSMQAYQQVTISGFNEYLNTMKKEKGNIVFSLTKFNSSGTVVGQAEPVKNVKELDNKTYRPFNNTPLYDAIGTTIKAVENNVKGKKVNVLITIMTDGEENSSREFTREQILKLIADKTKAGWVFTYLGANQDAWKVGESIGVHVGNTITYDQNKTTQVFAAVARGTSNYVKSDGSMVKGLMSVDNLGLDDKSYKDITGGAKPPTT